MSDGQIKNRDAKGRQLPGTPGINPKGRPVGSGGSRSYRKYLRDRCGDSGQLMWDTLIKISQGKTWVPKVKNPDGTFSTGMPQVPTASDRRLAATTILEYLHGKAPNETDIVKAEEMSEEISRIRSMRDEDLLLEAQRIQESYRAIDPGPITDAEIVPPQELPATCETEKKDEPRRDNLFW